MNLLISYVSYDMHLHLHYLMVMIMNCLIICIDLCTVLDLLQSYGD
jgi:hypothetical protein